MLTKTKTLIDKYTDALVVTGLLLVIVVTLSGTLVKAQILRNNPDVNNFKPNTEPDNPELDMFKGKVKPA